MSVLFHNYDHDSCDGRQPHQLSDCMTINLLILKSGLLIHANEIIGPNVRHSYVRKQQYK